MEEAGYWCHMCSQNVNAILEIESIKCPICQSGFVEEVVASPQNDDHEFGGSDSDGALSLWAPILLGMMGNQRRRRRMGFEDDEEAELDRELEALVRRRRSSAAILQLLQGMRAGIVSEDQGTAGTDRDSNESDRERVILINPFNQTIILQATNDSITRAPIGSLGDYFIGPGLDLLLQHLSENDPNRYGTPPAQKEAVEALPTVRIEDTLQCSICLDDCQIGDQVKEMPCKHKFHTNCILPWLDLHSSCPVCRHQLPCDESKLDSEGETTIDAGDDRNERGRQFSLPLPWPFSSLFSSNANPGTSNRDEN